MSAIKLILSGLVVCSLAACGGQMAVMSRSYTPPASGDTAKIRFSSNGEIVLFPNSRCVNWQAEGSGVVMSSKHYASGKPAHLGKRIGMKGEPPERFAFAEVLVASGKPLTFDFFNEEQSGNTIYTCTGNSTLVPKKGKEYQFIIFHDIESNGKCTIDVHEVGEPEKRLPVYPAKDC